MRAFILAAAVGIAGLGFVGAGTAQAQFYAGYGNGAHDYAPHFHQTLTPYGPTYYYGNGLHDYLPHDHGISPWGGVRSYGNGMFGPTKSYNGFPNYGGYGGGYGGYGGYGGGYGGYGGYGGW